MNKSKIEKFCDTFLTNMAHEHMRMIQCTVTAKKDERSPKDFEAFAAGYLRGLDYAVSVISELLGDKQDGPASHK